MMLESCIRPRKLLLADGILCATARTTPNEGKLWTYSGQRRILYGGGGDPKSERRKMNVGNLLLLSDGAFPIAHEEDGKFSRGTGLSAVAVLVD